MSTGEEKLCLKWNDFQENAISAFGTQSEGREFADVTLACEDDIQVEAHKVILAASSPLFLNILKRNKHPHPLIYMRGLKSEDLVAIVDLIYCGEVNIFQGSLDSFLAVAEELQLKGFMGTDSEKEPENKSNEFQPKKKAPKQDLTQNNYKKEASETNIFNPDGKLETMPTKVGTATILDYTVAADMQDLEEQIKSMMEVSEHMDQYTNGREWMCKVCGKKGMLGNIKSHIESKHITGVSHNCSICGKASKSRKALGIHKAKHNKQGVFDKN